MVVFKSVVECSRVVYKRAALGKTVQVDNTSVLSYCRGESLACLLLPWCVVSGEKSNKSYKSGPRVYLALDTGRQ